MWSEKDVLALNLKHGDEIRLIKIDGTEAVRFVAGCWRDSAFKANHGIDLYLVAHYPGRVPGEKKGCWELTGEMGMTYFDDNLGAVEVRK